MGMFDPDDQPDTEVYELNGRIDELQRRIDAAKELIKKAISECESEEKLGSMAGAIWSEAFRTRYFEKLLQTLDPKPRVHRKLTKRDAAALTEEDRAFEALQVGLSEEGAAKAGETL